VLVVQAALVVGMALAHLAGRRSVVVPLLVLAKRWGAERQQMQWNGHGGGPGAIQTDGEGREIPIEQLGRG